VGLGFELAESLSGSFYRLDDARRDLTIRLSLRLAVDGMRRFLRERAVQAEGVIIAEALAYGDGTGKRVRGALSWKLLDEKRIPYDLTFEGDDGKTYRLRGQRDFFAHDAIGSLTILPATLYDAEGAEIGRAHLRGGAGQELGALLKSFRPRVRVPIFSRG
jgi:hypothetical protein